jgi:FkbM family methyltransferase
VITNTKMLFSSVLRATGADCICDIGSRDGDQALLFRHLCPQAAVYAFEANPINFEVMARDERLARHQIKVFPFAISNAQSTAQFHITDVDYGDPHANKGTSSLLVGADIKIKNSIEVETRRIDQLLGIESPQARNIGLWIDVEGAEFGVLEGIEGIHTRVVAVHVETARVPFREGQKALQELLPLMRSYGFQMAGSNIPKEGTWGDVVFVREQVARSLGFRFAWCKVKGYMARWIRVDHAAVFLKARWPACYHLLRRAYLRVGT